MCLISWYFPWYSYDVGTSPPRRHSVLLTVFVSTSEKLTHNRVLLLGLFYIRITDSLCMLHELKSNIVLLPPVLPYQKFEALTWCKKLRGHKYVYRRQKKPLRNAFEGRAEEEYLFKKILWHMITSSVSCKIGGCWNFETRWASKQYMDK